MMRNLVLGIVAVMGLVGYGPQVAAQSPGPTPYPMPGQSLGPILVTPVPVISPLISPSPLGGGGGLVPNDPQSPGAGPVQGEETSPVGRRSNPPMPGPSPS
jgi:hypothetical protein